MLINWILGFNIHGELQYFVVMGDFVPEGGVNPGAWFLAEVLADEAASLDETQEVNARGHSEALHHVHQVLGGQVSCGPLGVRTPAQTRNR